MRDYLSNLVRRSLNLAEVVRPRPITLFEPLPATDRLATDHHADTETVEEELAYSQVMPAFSVPVFSLIGRQERPDDLPTTPSQHARQPIAQQLRPPAPIIPQSTGTKPEHPLIQPAPGPAKSAPSPLAPPPAETRPTLHPSRPRPGSLKPVPSQLSLQELSRRPGPGELTSPPVATHSKTDTMARQGRPTLEPAPRPGVIEQATVPGAPLSPTISPLEPRPIQGAVAAPPHITPHIESATHPPGQSAAMPEPTPTIRVTIGRIEVRAITPLAPPAPRPTRTKTGPVLSLDDYLKQRNGGGR